MHTNIDLAVSRWREQGVQLRPRLAQSRIAFLAFSYGLKISRDIEYLNSLCDGMEPDAEDNTLFHMHPLETALQHAKSYPIGWLPLGEGIVSSFALLLRPESEVTASVHIDYTFRADSTELIAESLDTALLYLRGSPLRLHLPD